MTAIVAINIDTSRLSRLATGSVTNGDREVLRELEMGATYLVVCFTRIRELSLVNATTKNSIVRFLRSVPTVFGQPDTILEASELAAGCALALNKPRTLPRPFGFDSAEWGGNAPTEGFTVADFVEHASVDTVADAQLRASAQRADDLARSLGSRSAVVVDRSGPALAQLDRYLSLRRSADPTFAADLTSSQIFALAGGLPAFPALQVVAELRAARLTEKNPASKNDMFDEDIARFHPYSAVSILDRATTSRFWRARVPGFERVFADMSRALEVIQRVRRGELSIPPCSAPSVA